jgi:hypothetical protein
MLAGTDRSGAENAAPISLRRPGNVTGITRWHGPRRWHDGRAAWSAAVADGV